MPCRLYASATLLLAAFCALAAGCAGSGETRPDSRPSVRGVPATCGYVRMEFDEREAQTNYDSDSVSLMLVYTPPGQPGGGDTSPVSTRVRVQRNRVDDLEAKLRASPTLICEPEPGAPGGYRAVLPGP